MGDASEQDQQLVRSHYDQRKSLGIAGREESRTFKVRTLHNWIKFALIEFDEHARRRSRPVVLDLCCGKGGDLNKFARVRARGVVCVDWARKSVEEAVRRWGSMRERFPVEFYCADCFEVDLGAHLHADLRFDLCSCHAHYAFASEGRARAMLRNVSSRLVPGGAAVLTLPDADELARRLRASGGDGFGNGFYRVRFDAGSAGRARGMELEEGAPEPAEPFGVRYEFYLEDSVGEAAGPGALELVPEFLAPLATLRRLAAEAGLELVFARNFRAFAEELGRDGAQVAALRRMLGGCAGHPLEALSPDEWEVSSLYAAVAFRKAAAAPGAGPSRKRDRDEERDARQQGHHPRREGDPGGPYDDRGDNAYSRQSDSGYSDRRGGYNDRWRGYDDRRGGSGDQRGRYDEWRGGYDDRRGGGYDGSRGGYDDRRRGHDGRRAGHDDWRGGYDDRRGGYERGGSDERRMGYDGRRGYDDGGGFGDRRGAREAGERACPIVLVPGFSASDIRSLP